jgi:hypothetical protein
MFPSTVRIDKTITIRLFEGSERRKEVGRESPPKSSTIIGGKWLPDWR